ncbi:glycosyltransferase [Vibrio sp. 1640]|uniref:glycosyltransferase n=1 Tax=Vibrio sp. 1640 TaxID=3074570 RepID=UPI00296540E8|nr:glycosyltransferase [Vibrio sp. 1640]MDW2080740.1 glycosyltransferase [Vibrio sp. 1640]
MKVLFIGVDPDSLGGIQTFSRNLSELLSLDSVYFPSLIGNLKGRYLIKQFMATSMLFRFLKIIGVDNVIYSSLLKRYVKNNGIKYIILNTPQSLKYLSGIGAKVILVQHQSFDSHFSRREYFNNENDLISKCNKILYKFVMLSDLDKQEYLERQSFKQDKLTVIRHFSHMPVLKVEKSKSKNLVMMCRLDNKHKRIDLAIEAMKDLPDFTLNIYGSGPDEQFLKKIVLELDLKNVIFHKQVLNVQGALDENAIHVMTSDFEGYPISNIEATLRGLPIIVRNTFTSASDIVGENGILLDAKWERHQFSDAVRAIYENYNYYSQMALVKACIFDPTKAKNEWEKIIK